MLVWSSSIVTRLRIAGYALHALSVLQHAVLTQSLKLELRIKKIKGLIEKNRFSSFWNDPWGFPVPGNPQTWAIGFPFGRLRIYRPFGFQLSARGSHVPGSAHGVHSNPWSSMGHTPSI